MSLINKMLQDLDARGSQAGSALQSEIKPVAIAGRKLPVAQMAIAAGVAVAALAAAGVWWFKRPAAPAAAAPVVVVVPPPKPAAPPKAAAVIAPTIPLSAAQMPVLPAPARAKIVASAPVMKLAKAERARFKAPLVTAPAAPVPVSGGRDMNDAQRSETQYRNALTALDEGRVAGAVDMLEQTLKLNPRHDAARQSLVALLIEAGRNDEAMQQLEQGLAIDPGQPSLAMLLARMQIERGVSGVATLLRTLPAASGNADYHAFLAGALQRDQRHKEAATYYSAALRSAPENGVWLMGLGISLQADKRDAEALEAFKRARASGVLNVQLVAFVDRKIQQLTP